MSEEQEIGESNEVAVEEATQPAVDGPQLASEELGIDESRLYAALCYLAVLIFVPILTRKHDPFVNFHIRQGLLLLAWLIIALLAAQWSSAIGSLLFLLYVIADVTAIATTLQGRRWKAPLLGSLAEKVRI